MFYIDNYVNRDGRVQPDDLGGQKVYIYKKGQASPVLLAFDKELADKVCLILNAQEDDGR